MKLFRQYLATKKKLFSALAVFAVLFFVSFLLFRLPLRAVLYPAPVPVPVLLLVPEQVLLPVPVRKPEPVLPWSELPVLPCRCDPEICKPLTFLLQLRIFFH